MQLNHKKPMYLKNEILLTIVIANDIYLYKEDVLLFGSQK